MTGVFIKPLTDDSMLATRLKTFISYKSEYRDTAKGVRDALQSWGHETWFDQDDIAKGAYFRDEIQQGLESSDVVIGILTPEALKSREVLTEWDFAFSNHDEKRLLLLRYDEVDLPYWLAGVQYIDCTADETDALNQLRVALSEPDTSAYKDETVPSYIRRHTSPTDASFDYSVTNESQRENDNRAKMLYNVYQSWIRGALHPNLPEGAIDLGLSLKPDAVLRHTEYGDYELPDSGRKIGQIFTDANGELLILGEPGSGKTILMLQLTQYLLGQAQHDPTQAMPVVFNLASWSRDQKPFTAWLVDELWRSYGVPKKTGEKWVEAGKLTLLLDGLDEIAPSQGMMPGASDIELDRRAIELRSACIDAINSYRADLLKDDIGVDIVVCSRIKDYEALHQQLDLNTAILLVPLSDAQIEDYLAGADYAGTRQLIAEEPEARDKAQTPFLLTMMKVAYRGMPYSGSPFNQLQLPDDTGRQTHLLSAYIDKQLAQNPHENYEKPETLYYLRWLAHQMVKNKKSVFYIEDLQPDWSQQHERWRISVSLLFGLIGGLIVGFTVGIIFGLIGGLRGGLALDQWSWFGSN
ncbi:MAG: TIR domain-containing protein [Chloroflexota bacterium]